MPTDPPAELARYKRIVQQWSDGANIIDGIFVCSRCRRPIMDFDSIDVGPSHWHPSCYEEAQAQLKEEIVLQERLEQAETELSSLREAGRVVVDAFLPPEWASDESNPGVTTCGRFREVVGPLATLLDPSPADPPDAIVATPFFPSPSETKGEDA